MPYIQWRKDCECKSAATMPNIKIEQIYFPAVDDNLFTIKIVYHPGPSCDNCGKLWRVVAEGTG